MKHLSQPLAQPAFAPAAAPDAAANLKSVLSALAGLLGRQAAAEFVRATALSSPYPTLEPCT